MKMVWASLCSSTVFFLVVGIMIAAPRDEPPPTVMLFALAATSLALVAASQLLPKQILVTALRSQKFQVVEPPAQDRMFNDAPRRGRKFADPVHVRNRLVFCAQSPFILGLALSEAVALMGLVLMMQGFELEQTLAFFVTSWVLLATKFPRLETFQRVLEATYDAQLGPG
jgi:hypothetical protein